jgi:voltage-gated potassium channel
MAGLPRVAAAPAEHGVTTPTRTRLADVGEKVRAAPTNPFERRMTRFLREPPSIRMAASVIVTATTLVVVGGGALMRVLDHNEYSSIWVGMWWALQTVTTVGYGDVTPKDTIGRIIGAVVMLQGIAFLTILTAAITSTFVARAERERFGSEAPTDAGRADGRFDEVVERLDRIEAMLRRHDRD